MKRPFLFHGPTVRPPPLLVIGFFSVYGLTTLLFWLLYRTNPVLNDIVQNVGRTEAQGLQQFILIITAVLYAIYRLWRFHPALNSAYASWLQMTPWTAHRPLPAGPIHPVWQDVAVVACLTAIAVWHAGAEVWSVPLGFVLTYLVGLTLLLWYTRRWGATLTLGLLWPALFLPGMESGVGFVVLALIVAVIWYGHRKGLQAFPWGRAVETRPRPPNWTQSDIKLNFLRDDFGNDLQFRVGWPLTALSPKFRIWSVPTSSGIALSLLFGWWSYCLITFAREEISPEVIVFLGILAALFRVVIYCPRLIPSCNLWGRLATGKLIMPGFDKIFVTPLAVVLVALLGGMLVRRSGSSYAVVESGVITLLWLILFCGGPKLKPWILTGQHRYFFFRSTANAGGRNQLRQI